MDGPSLSYAERLRDRSEAADSVLSVGYDPAPEAFPVEGVSGYDASLPDPTSDYEASVVEDRIVSYFRAFLAARRDRGVQVGAFKFNLGYFRMYDGADHYAGSNALREVLDATTEASDAPVVLDVKDADIARSSAAFAISKLQFEAVDAITVSPYMGSDSVVPFLEFADDRGKGVYVLTRTTNPGGADLQELPVSDGAAGSPVGDRDDGDSTPLFLRVAALVREWSERFPGTVGAVAAGNDTADLAEIAGLFSAGRADVPLLIPGVGTQGGSASEVIDVLDGAGYDPRLARINSSSGIMYAAQKSGAADDHATAALRETRRLNEALRHESFASDQ